VLIVAERRRTAVSPRPADFGQVEVHVDERAIRYYAVKALWAAMPSTTSPITRADASRELHL
jgi:hypothetical protein